MAVFGKLSDIKHQINDGDFIIAFNYLENLGKEIFDLKENECVKEMITDDIFILRQAYKTKNREDCFFESHKKYIDIQYMVKGDELMDVTHIENLEIIKEYDKKTDFIKYENKSDDISTLLIKEKELAIFYPNDAHQPCIKVNNSELIYKAVIKIPVE